MVARVVVGWACGVVVLLGAWQASAWALGHLTVPPPRAVLAGTWEHAGRHLLHARVTGWAALGGLALASGATALAILTVAAAPRAEHALYPVLTMLKSAPAVAFVPVFVTLVGSGPGCKALTSATICFFPLVIGALDGLERVPPQLRVLADSYGAGRCRAFLQVNAPFALSGFATGLRTAAPLAVVGSIVGEYVAGGLPRGLGTYIMQHYHNFLMRETFEGVVTASLLGFLFFGAATLVSHVAERRMQLALAH